MDAVELAGLPAAFAEACEHFEGLAVEDVDAVVFAVADVEEFLVLVARKRDVPGSTRAARGGFDEDLLDKLAVGFENLNAVVAATADVEQAIFGEHGAVDGIAELDGGRR